MRKLTLFFGALIIASFTLSSCGGSGSMESDAQRFAELTCKASGLMKKVMSGDEDAKAESEKLGEKMKELQKELEAKYTSDADKEKFKEAILEASKDCNENEEQ